MSILSGYSSKVCNSFSSFQILPAASFLAYKMNTFFFFCFMIRCRAESEEDVLEYEGKIGKGGGGGGRKVKRFV